MDPAMNRETDSRIKEELLSAAREMATSGLVEGTAGNLSARLDNERIVVTPASLDYAGMTASDLVVLDSKGNVLEGQRTPTTECALHLACLNRHADIGAVLHCHALFASMFAVVHSPIPCVVEEFDIYVGGEVPVADYRRTGSDALGEEVARHLEDRGAVLMANHGLVCVGKNSADALRVARLVERTAQLIWGAQLMGSPVPLPESTRAHFAPLYKKLGRL
jgi:L-fuculose-phosphate aldolase